MKSILHALVPCPETRRDLLVAAEERDMHIVDALVEYGHLESYNIKKRRQGKGTRVLRPLRPAFAGCYYYVVTTGNVQDCVVLSRLRVAWDKGSLQDVKDGVLLYQLSRKQRLKVRQRPSWLAAAMSAPRYYSSRNDIFWVTPAVYKLLQEGPTDD